MTIKIKRDVHLADQFFHRFLLVFAIGFLLLLFSMAFFLGQASIPIFRSSGWSFFITKIWNPVEDQYGALAFVYGTLVSSLIGVLLATPVSVGVALYLNELAAKPLRSLIAFLIQMLAAIPSVVYGLWGIFVLAPWLRTTVEPLLEKSLGFLPLFQGPKYGVGMLAAGMILAIMIIPTISSLCYEVFKTIGPLQKEAALALGATRWEMMKIAILQSSRAGILSAIILGLGRALGETMAVTMVIGNRSEIDFSLFAPAQTMASLIANEYAEAAGETHLSALSAIGFSLFMVTLFVNLAARFIIWQMSSRAQRRRSAS